MDKPTLYLHVGPPKTATTFLQNEVLYKLRSHSCHIHPSIKVADTRLPMDTLFHLSPLIWGEVNENPFNEKGQCTLGHTLVSDESIIGGVAPPTSWMPNRRLTTWKPNPNPWFGPATWKGPATLGHKHGRPYPHLVSCHLRELKRVSSNWGYERVRLLLTTRRQDTRLASEYAQKSNKLQGPGQRSFERWVRSLLHTVGGRFDGGGEKLNYSVWYQELTEAIGEENVLFLPFELLRGNRTQFLKRWLGFIGAEDVDAVLHALSDSEEQNVRSTSTSEWSLRKPVRTYLKFRPVRVFQALGLPRGIAFRWPDFLRYTDRGEKIRLTEDISEEILDFYEEGNRRLDTSDSDLNLKKYGYY